MTLTYITDGHRCFMTHSLVTENNQTKCEEDWSTTEGDKVRTRLRLQIDRRMDRWMDGQTDLMKPVYPPSTL